MNAAFIGMLVLLSTLAFTRAQSACNVPPFLTTAVPPNILFVVDKSGSMSWAAYNPNSRGIGFCDRSSGCGNTYTGKEEGYFIPDAIYMKVGSCNSSNRWNCYWQQTTGTANPCPNRWQDVYNRPGRYKGSCLNFLLMSRMDLLRWAVTGGRPYACNPGSYTSANCDPDIACTGNTCELATLYNDRVIVPKSRIRGIVQELEKGQTKPRLGVLFFSNGIEAPKVYIGDYPSPTGGDPGSADPNHPYTYFKRFINAMLPGGGTGTAVAMWEAYDYFKQSDDHGYSNGFRLGRGTYRDPMYICDYRGNNCSPAPCAKNFVILASDGNWNYGGFPPRWTCTIETGYENYSADPVVPAYRMHTDTLRTMTELGNSYNINVSAVYALGLFLGGTGEQSLKNVAMYGSFDTRSNTWPRGTSGSRWNGGGGRQYPWGTCTMDDCGPGRGSGCTPLPTSSPDWDKNGDGVPDTFFNAKNAVEIKESLLAFMRDILKRASSASSVSILSRRGTAGNNVIQAVFYPQKSFPNGNKVDWVGYVYNYWFYLTSTEQSIREDTNLNKILDVNQDYKLDFVVDSSGNLIIDAYNNSGTKVTTYSSLDKVNPIWEAGEILKNTSPNDRNIYTVSSSGNLVKFTIANKSSFSTFLGNTANFPACLSFSGDPVNNLIEFIRGKHIDGCRDRRVDLSGNTWKLGDIVYSTPAIVNYGTYSMVFIGANDGMLHAFRIGALRTDGLSPGQAVKLCDELTGSCTYISIGKEEWAFIPQNALPYLRELAAPDYNHIYIVDLQPYIIRLDTNGDGFPDKVILIGGMRLGGGCGCTGPLCENPPSDVCNPATDPSGCRGLSSYFALDITDPQNPIFLWEFSDPDLGYSYSGPAHISVNGKHFIMFVSGPTSTCGDSAQELKVFVLEMNNSFKIAGKYVFFGNTSPTLSSKYTKIRSLTLTQFNNSFGGRLFTEGIDYDKDGNTDMVFFGVNKKWGSIWRGNVLAVDINSADPTTWSIKKVFNSDIEPITAKVEYVKCFGMNYIFFGTGRWFFKNDEPGQNVNDKEKLYGVRIDGCLTGGRCNVNQVKRSNDACAELSSGGDVFSWYRELAPKGGGYNKERLVSDPAVTSYNVVFFATTQPTENLCGFGGRSRLWGLNCATGAGLLDSSCPTYIASPPANTSVLLQLSRGNIEVIGKGSFTKESGSATEWFTGTAPEPPPTVPGGRSVQGRIILWLER